MLVKIMIDCARMLSRDYKMLLWPSQPFIAAKKSLDIEKYTSDIALFIQVYWSVGQSSTTLSRSIPKESFIFVWILPQHHLYSICVCDPSICLHMRRNHIIAQCLCSCLSLANLHLPSSAQEATFLCLLPFRFNIFFGFCFIFFRLSFSAAFVGVKEDIYGKKIPLFLRLESRDLLLMCFTLNITVSAFL